jgi:hypothetical protein
MGKKPYIKIVICKTIYIIGLIYKIMAKLLHKNILLDDTKTSYTLCKLIYIRVYICKYSNKILHSDIL